MTNVRLRHIAQINPPSPLFDRLSGEDAVTFLPMEAVWPGERLDLSRERKKAAVATGFTRFENGDVLVPKITPTFEAGRAVLVDNLRNGVGTGTTELHVLRAGAEIDNRFLLYVVNTHSFLKFGEAEMYGVAGQQRVPDRFLRDLRLHLPSLDEQRRIADFLDAETSRIDALVNLRSRQIGLLHAGWIATLSGEMDGLTSIYGNVRLRHWVSSIQQGWSPQCDDRIAGDNEWAVVKAGCVNTGRFDPLQHKALPPDIAPREEYLLKIGDLLMSRASGSPDLIGSVGVVRDLPAKLLLCDKIYRITPHLAVAKAEFIAYALRGYRNREHIKNGISGAEGMANNLPVSVVKDCLIPKAPIQSQAAVVGRLDRQVAAVESATSALRRSIVLLSERRQSLITSAIVGQLDVTTASGQASA